MHYTDLNSCTINLTLHSHYLLVIALCASGFKFPWGMCLLMDSYTEALVLLDVIMVLGNTII